MTKLDLSTLKSVSGGGRGQQGCAPAPQNCAPPAPQPCAPPPPPAPRSSCCCCS